ncbi:hypothetical protein ENUP19_0364G0044 [Entamoeba nuttalli]|uniref:Tyrosine kinase, putative n=2 Tax=Entamoeba nuttalli TaxID=412467 RepID=K2GB61_ENTNP|nr:tyrosine kinase, putative [Entamoeba nuttalli P19]EKE39731.1 tyrosine kinase, putative [Entamoeba nuttalli P19]|eukprot:XP_008857934.1 tyrosine kinase, putative [Entamoeba nuttalli P19]
MLFYFILFQLVNSDCWYSQDNEIIYDPNLSGMTCSNRGYGWKLIWDGTIDWIIFTGECCENNENYYSISSLAENRNPKGITFDESATVSLIKLLPPFVDSKWIIDGRNINNECEIYIGNAREYVVKDKETIIIIGTKTLKIYFDNQEINIIQFKEKERPYMFISGNSTILRVQEDYQINECHYLFNAKNVIVEQSNDFIIQGICSFMSQTRYIKCPKSKFIENDCSCFIKSTVSEVSFTEFTMNYPDCFVSSDFLPLTIKSHQTNIKFDQHNHWLKLIIEPRTQPLFIQSNEPITIKEDFILPSITFILQTKLIISSSLIIQNNENEFYYFKEIYASSLKVNELNKNKIIFNCGSFYISNNFNLRIGCKNGLYNRIVLNESQIECNCYYNNNTFDQNDCNYVSQMESNQLKLFVLNKNSYHPKTEVYWNEIIIQNGKIGGFIKANKCILDNTIIISGILICNEMIITNSIIVNDIATVEINHLIIKGISRWKGNCHFIKITVNGKFDYDGNFVYADVVEMSEDTSITFINGGYINNLTSTGYCAITSAFDLIINECNSTYMIDIIARSLTIKKGMINFNILSVTQPLIINEQVISIAINSIIQNIDNLFLLLDIQRTSKPLIIQKIPIMSPRSHPVAFLETKKRPSIVISLENQFKYMCDNQVIIIGNITKSPCSSLHLDNKICNYIGGSIYLNSNGNIDYSCPCNNDKNVNKTLMINSKEYYMKQNEEYNQIYNQYNSILYSQNKELVIILEKDIQINGNNNSILFKLMNDNNNKTILNIHIKGTAILFCELHFGYDINIQSKSISLSQNGLCKVVVIENNKIYCVVCRYLMKNNECLSGKVEECMHYTKNGKCFQCNEGYYIDKEKNKCNKCSEHCQYCNSNECILCYNGYQLQNKKCVLYKEPCNYFKGDICYKCPLGYYNINGNCNKCKEGCIMCQNNNTCESCDIGNGYFGTNCSYIEHSKIISSIVICEYGYYYNGNNCTQCGNNCGECQIDSYGIKTCLSCISDEYYLNEQGECILGKDICYIDNWKCISCINPNEYFNGLNCISCGEYCTLCSTTGICEGCENGYYLHKELNEYDQIVFQCKPNPISNCIEYNKGKCISCNNGTYSNNYQCLPCHVTCLNCVLNSKTCLSCISGFMIQDNTCISAKQEIESCEIFASEIKGECAKCKDFYYLNQSICERCSNNCKICNNLTSCIECGINYFLNETGECESIFHLTNCKEFGNKGCIYCDNDTYLDGIRCVYCNDIQPYCNKCHWESGICIGCKEEYILYQGKCIHYSFISHCKMASNSICIKCSFWYEPTITGIECEINIKWWIIIIILILILIVMILLITILYIILINICLKRNQEYQPLLKYQKVSQTHLNWINLHLKGIVVNKKTLKFTGNVNELVEIDQPISDTFYIGNTNKETIYITFTYLNKNKEKYCILIKPEILQLKQDDCYCITVTVIPYCTTIINEQLKIVKTNNKLGIDSIDSINIKLRTQLSTKLDYDELIIEEKIGEGTFGIVYKGIFRNNIVAIKNLKNIQIIEGVVEEFKREIFLLENFRSDYIVYFYGSVLWTNKFCIVTEFAQYGSLQNLMNTLTLNEISLKLRIKLLIDASKGIKYLHSNGILHRDIKPDNLLIFSLDQDIFVNAKLSDFGSSRSINLLVTNLTFTSGIGTPVYMAPELLKRKKYKMSADIYSFAILMYECINWCYAYPISMKTWNIAQDVCSGKRPPKVDSMNSSFYELLTQMWCDIPNERLTIDEVVRQLEYLRY